METSQSGMDNPTPTTIQPVRVGPEKEPGGRGGVADQSLVRQGPLPMVTGIHFLMPPLSKESFPSTLTL